MRKRIWAAGLLAAAAAGCTAGRAEEMRAPEVGARAPAFSAPDLAGRVVSLDSLRGRVVLLNLWASWCPPCREEMPALERLHRELAPAGLSVVAVSVDDDLGAVPPFLRDAGITFTVLHDNSGGPEELFRAPGLPTTFLIGRDGVIRHRWIGEIEPDSPEVRGAVRTALDAG